MSMSTISSCALSSMLASGYSSDADVDIDDEGRIPLLLLPPFLLSPLSLPWAAALIANASKVGAEMPPSPQYRLMKTKTAARKYSWPALIRDDAKKNYTMFSSTLERESTEHQPPWNPCNSGNWDDASRDNQRLDYSNNNCCGSITFVRRQVRILSFLGTE